MARFLARRLLFGLLVLWIVSGAVFVLFKLLPGNPLSTNPSQVCRMPRISRACSISRRRTSARLACSAA